MPIPRRRGAVVGLLTVGLGLIGFAIDVARRQAPVGGVPAIWPSPRAGSEPADDELERHRQAIVRRSQIKDEAIRGLLAGRLTLLQAAAQFRDADAAVPMEWRSVRPAAAGGPAEGERQCREVIAWARIWLAVDRSPQAADVGARLDAELQRALVKDGVVHLPD